jgi:small-conductance mechanosensitive channel
LALAAVLFGFGTMAAALAVGGNVAMIALGLVLSGLSMDLFCIAKSQDRE